MEDNYCTLPAIDLATISTEPSVMRLLVGSNSLIKHELVESEGDDFYVLEFNENDPILMNSEINQDAFTNDISIAMSDDFQSFTKTNLKTVTLPDGSQAFLAPSVINDELLKISNTEITYVQTEDYNEHVLDNNFSSEINNIKIEEAEEEIHGKKYACLYKGCDRRYTTKHHLRVHERVHTGERPYVCDTCNRSFATSYSLKTHCRTHTGARPFECTYEDCKKGFKTSGDLQKHIRTHTGERPFTCLVEGCHRRFTTSNIMKVHMRTHTGERPYACKYCDKKFSSTTNYRNHERIHTGIKPYACSVESCGKRFTEYSSLYKHQVVHLPSRQFKCNICDRVFKLGQTLQNHYLAAHSLTIDEDKNETENLIFLQGVQTTTNLIENSLNDSSIII